MARKDAGAADYGALERAAHNLMRRTNLMATGSKP